MHRKQQELHWLQSVYKNCETLGISGFVIKRFETYYLEERNDQNNRIVSTTKRT